MNTALEHLRLQRTGPAEATIGMISLPLPRDGAATLRIDHPAGDMLPVGWWKRHELPRRAMAYVVDDAGVPDTLRLTDTPSEHNVGDEQPWTVDVRIVKEKLDFTPPKFNDIASLRGVPAADCTTVEFELLLTHGSRTLGLQFGATGPKGGPYYWQNVQVDRLWRNRAAQGIRVGGVVYNEDTYLWVDAYLVLFANGVINVAAHYVVTKLHIEGYDFVGLPVMRLRGEGVKPVEHSFPADGLVASLGDVKLNLADSQIMFSEEEPARLVVHEDEAVLYPFSRIVHPQLPDTPDEQWEPGFARTVRFQMSLSDAPALVARYTAPSWWYAHCGEPWAFGTLPVDGHAAGLSAATVQAIRESMVRGNFSGGSGGKVHGPMSSSHPNDGDAGVGMMQCAYHTGRPEVHQDALDYCYYWADLAVDHRDFTVHQWVGGWPWKTCAYSKFRDVLYGYLETGDPHLLDTVENCAESYWQWYRSNWPRCAIGRDNFELGAWALLWRFLDTERARERCEEYARMNVSVIADRGMIGGQMGAGPHPGILSSLYMTGVTMIGLCDILEAAHEKLDEAQFTPWYERIRPALDTLGHYFMRRNIELFPSNFATRGKVHTERGGVWRVLGMRAFSVMAQLDGRANELTAAGLHDAAVDTGPWDQSWITGGRIGNNMIHPLYLDSLLLGATWRDDGSLYIRPIASPTLWPAEQTVHTPAGPLRITTDRTDDGVTLRFEGEPTFDVRLDCDGQTVTTTSRGECTVPAAEEAKA